MPRRPKFKVVSNQETKAYDRLFGKNRGIHYQSGGWERFRSFALMKFRRVK